MMQSALRAVRDFFPNAEVDYVINKMVAPPIEGNPDATRIMPVYSDGRYPSSTDIKTLREIVRKGHYDLCLNFCTFIEKKDLAESGQSFVRFLSYAPTIIHNESDSVLINHFSLNAYQFSSLPVSQTS